MTNLGPLHKKIVNLGCSLFLLFFTIQVAQAESFTLTNDEGFTFTINDLGISKVQLKGKTIAQGAWLAWDSGPKWFGTKDPRVATPKEYYLHDIVPVLAKKLKSAAIEKISTQSIKVRQTWAHITVTHLFVLKGKDLNIYSRIENNSRNGTIHFPTIGGLRIAFQRSPKGIIRTWHPSYLASARFSIFHPSNGNKIGGSFMIDGKFGLGVSPENPDPDARTLILTDYDTWQPGQRDKDPIRWICFVSGSTIPAGAARTLSLTLRFSRSQNWKVLLEPYKKHFLSTYGPRRYKAEMPLIMAMANINGDKSFIKKGNPYGLHDNEKRLDTDAGLNKFTGRLIPALKKVHGQGVIIWGQTGENPRGEMYRTDFDVIPPAIEKRLKVLNKRFSAAGLRWGVCTRPGEVTFRRTWEKDGTIRLNGDDPEHLKMVAARFKNLMADGATLFYLDSFGNSLNDVKIMRYVRSKIGPNIATFSEHTCDVMMTLSGVYTETEFFARGSQPEIQEDQYRPRTSLQFLRVCRWMIGDIPVISRFYEKHGDMPANFESPEKFLWRHSITPLIPQWLLPSISGQISKEEAVMKKRFFSQKRWELKQLVPGNSESGFVR